MVSRNSVQPGSRMPVATSLDVLTMLAVREGRKFRLGVARPLADPPRGRSLPGRFASNASPRPLRRPLGMCVMRESPKQRGGSLGAAGPRAEAPVGPAGRTARRSPRWAGRAGQSGHAWRFDCVSKCPPAPHPAQADGSRNRSEPGRSPGISLPRRWTGQTFRILRGGRGNRPIGKADVVQLNHSVETGIADIRHDERDREGRAQASHEHRAR